MFCANFQVQKFVVLTLFKVEYSCWASFACLLFVETIICLQKDFHAEAAALLEFSLFLPSLGEKCEYNLFFVSLFIIKKPGQDVILVRD